MVPRNTLFGDKILRHALFLCNGSDEKNHFFFPNRQKPYSHQVLAAVKRQTE